MLLPVLMLTFTCSDIVNLRQIALSSLTELAEVAITGNPVCSSADGSNSMEILFQKLLPHLEVLDGVRFHGSVDELLYFSQFFSEFINFKWYQSDDEVIALRLC